MTEVDSKRSILACFVPFLKRILYLYVYSVPIYRVTLSSALSYTYTHVFFERTKKVSSGVCEVFEETLCEWLLHH